jgi:hypothetical protein
LKRVNLQLQDSAKLTDDVVKALEFEADRIRTMQSLYDLTNQKIAKQKELETGKFDQAEVTRLEAEVRAREALTGKVNELSRATGVLLETERSAADVLIDKLDVQIQKLRELDAERQREFPGIKTYYSSQITALQEKLNLLKQEKAVEEDKLARGILPGQKMELPADFFKESKPEFLGPTASLELAKIKTDFQAANQEAVKVIDSVQTQNQKFKEQVAILDELRSKGLLTQQQYQAAFKKAEEEADKVSGEWKKLGNEIGSQVSAALSFQQSWSQAFKTILADILKVIVQMELMKALGASGVTGGGGGGIGGFLGAVFGGFKAAGGPVDDSHAYIVGEHGPEIFAPKGAGHIIPAGHTAAALQPNVTYQHTQYITTPDADSFQKSSAQIAADAYENMAASHARNR